MEIKAIKAACRAAGRQVTAFTDDSINSGGCGVYAVALADALAKLGVKCTIVHISPWDYYKDGTDAMYHVGVCFEAQGRRWIADSNGCRLFKRTIPTGPWKDHNVVHSSWTVESLRARCASPNGWNRTFKRSHIPQVKRTVQSFFKNV